MKKVGVLAMISFLVLNSALGKLRNGYETGIDYVRESLQNYNELLDASNNLSASDRRKIRNRVSELLAYESYYELTEELLSQFKRISPNLYNRVDAIKDAKGRSTDVYVKFIPREEASVMAEGTTRMAQTYGDEHACFSEYGNHSVSVKIWISSKSLLVLSHELGHVTYQVPNLQTYTEYYEKMYPSALTDANCIGHSPNDASGKGATTAEREFKKDFLRYLRVTRGETRLGSPLVLIQEIKKRISNNHLLAAM